MRMSQLFFRTLKEQPQDAVIPSHILLLRAGFIYQLTSGVYNFLPLGFRVLRKIWRIVQEEMDAIGSQELLMPAIHPKELWQRTGRWDLMDDISFKFTDRNGRWHLLGTTHEEVITWLASLFIKSWRDLPKALYQIQVKFRDEPRPRGGLLRGREFIMKDLYSFHIDTDDLDRFYWKVYNAYLRAFKRMGLKTYAVEAHSGAIGGDVSHEFMLISDSGEDRFVLCDSCGYSASVEIAQRKAPESLPEANPKRITEFDKVYTPDTTSVEELTSLLNRSPRDFIKSLLYVYDDGYVLALVRGDRELNEIKLAKTLNVSTVRMATPEEFDKLHLTLGYIGPVGLNRDDIKLVADYSVLEVRDGIVGANEVNYHLVGISAENIIPDMWADISSVTDGDPCPHCGKPLKVYPSIELGHIFKLGTKYSQPLKAYYTDKDGKLKPIIMGCYGIGVSRLVAAVVEQWHDENGIIWPISVSPYQVHLLTVNVNDESQMNVSNKLYTELTDNGIEVLWDDRDETPGIKFKDMDLIGVPVRIVIGKHIRDNRVELSLRREPDRRELINIEDTVNRVREMISKLMLELQP